MKRNNARRGSKDMKGGESKERLQVSCFRTMGLEGPRGIKGKLLIYSLRCSTECIDTVYMAIRSRGSIQLLRCFMLFHRRQPLSRCKSFESITTDLNPPWPDYMT
ncbi:hypothetical protein XANCAGTX0491_009115 [Xanthoria calcicola]